MCNAYCLDTWCDNLKCVCHGSKDLALASFGCAAMLLDHKPVKLNLFAVRSRMASQPARYLLKQGRMLWMDDGLVDTITMTPASTAEAKEIAALVYGGPSAYDRWACVKIMLLRRTWASTNAWKRGTQNDQERASVYRIVQKPETTRDSVHATMICRM